MFAKFLLDVLAVFAWMCKQSSLDMTSAHLCCDHLVLFKSFVASRARAPLSIFMLVNLGLQFFC